MKGCNIKLLGSKTIQTITKYHDTLKSEEPTNEELDFVRSFESLLAQNIVLDFDEKSSRRIANIILAITS